MTEYEHSELLRIFLNKTRGKEPWFDYTPRDVAFWEEVRVILEEHENGQFYTKSYIKRHYRK